ncbi:hypothetical protein POM88_030838 [Heracleum sosnowskyi]|uniref:Uncharacterized protein n=1 Tax=Heracleum sosnowskyi TaxID=360622 RepID=A0AAD8HWN0_9APIA|nr:hypothetical protein POM88_030838 [Heracleum sosnowskyi]
MFSILDISQEENVITKRNGIACVEPSMTFLHNSSLNWVNCCYALSSSIANFDFNVIKEQALVKFSSLGFINVFSHLGGRVGGWVVLSSSVPLLEGLGILGLAMGTPISLDMDIYKVAVRNEPILEAQMIIEVGVLDHLQSFIPVDAYRLKWVF